MNANRHSIIAGNNRLVVAIAVVSGALWLALVAYVLIDTSEPDRYVKPGEVVVHAPSPVASGVPAIRSSHSSPMLFSHHSGAGAVSPSAYSFVSFSQGASSGGSMKMFETSNATVHSIGGGGSGGGGGASGAGGSSSGGTQGKGIHSTALAGGGAIHVAIPSIMISEPGATSAPAMASTVTDEGPRAMPNGRKVGPDPFDPMLDPVGDVTWGLMLLLTIGWCVRVHRKRQQACK